MLNTEKLVLYLCICAINNLSPSMDILKGADFEEIYRYSTAHKVTALVCYALEKVIQVPLLFLEARTKAVRKEVLLDAELQRIFSFLEDERIFYMPLKGALLKDLYPCAGMRQMSDVDIFYDIRFREDIKKYMFSAGYECTACSDSQDAYKRQPVYNFEFHHLLFSSAESKDFYSYYKNVVSRLIKDNDSCRYNMSNEDFYIYLIAHEYKHFSQFGTGLRSLLDAIIFFRHYEDTLDTEYICRELEKINLSEFEKKQRELCRKINGDKPFSSLTVDEEKLLSCFLGKGVYGDYRTGIANRIAGKTAEKDGEITKGKKLKYVFGRVFPPAEYYRVAYPFFYKHKILIPFCVIYRIVLALFRRSDFVRIEFEELKKNQKEN